MTDWLKTHWPALAIGAAVALIAYSGAWEWIVAPLLGWWGLSRETNGDPPDRAPADEASGTDVVDETAQDHNGSIEPPDEADPADAFRQQAEDL